MSDEERDGEHFDIEEFRRAHEMYELNGEDTVALMAEIERLYAAIEELADEWGSPNPGDDHWIRAPLDPEHAANRLRALIGAPEDRT